MSAPAPFVVRPGLTTWLGMTLLLGATSSALAWSNGVTSLTLHLVTSVPMLYFLFICIHDGVHGCLHRSPKINDAVAWFLGACTLLPFPLLRSAHLQHHAQVGQTQDPEHIVYGATLPQLLLRLPVVPFYYLREVRHLGVGTRLSVALHFATWAGLVVAFGAPLVEGWLLPVLLAVVWFGFTTVYVPHSRHRGLLMRHLNWHSGYHHDHHRMMNYPSHQYFQVRLHGLLRKETAPTNRWEVSWLKAATWDLSAAAAGLLGRAARRGDEPESGTPSGS